MAHDDDYSWMLLSRSTDEWEARLDKFVDNMFEDMYASEKALCPCSKCCGVAYKAKSEVHFHLLSKGFDENFVKEKRSSIQSWDNDMDVHVGPSDDAAAGCNLVSSLIRGLSSDKKNEEPNDSAKKFYALLKDAQEELGSGSPLTKLSFMVRLFQIKCMGGWSNNSTGQALELFSDAYPPDIASQILLRKHGKLFAILA